MADFPQSPLTEEHLQQINNSLDVIKYAEQQIELAQRAGIDVTADKAKLAQTKDQLLRVKNVYFPNR